MPVATRVALDEQPRRGGAQRAPHSRPTLKLLLLGLVLIGLGAILGFSIHQEVAGPTASSQPGAPPRPAQRPALTADEQTYVELLWPIHTAVEVAAERVALGTIFYKTNDLERTELKVRLDESLATYRDAQQKLGALHPPPSLVTSHSSYLSALDLFEHSTVEMLKMFDDGSDDHLLTAYPNYVEGTNRIRDLGGKFWPDEFPPN
jgi:hypothetical protein